MQVLSERTGTAAHVKNEEDVTIACDLADDLRDAIVEYQVSAGVPKCTFDSSLTVQFIVRAAEGNL